MKKSALAIFLLIILSYIPVLANGSTVKSTETWLMKGSFNNDKFLLSQPIDDFSTTKALAFVSLDGKITHNGIGISGVTVTLSGAVNQVFITDASGDYHFPVTDGLNYTITPVKVGYTFTPLSVSYFGITKDTVFNFSTVIPKDTITGTITINGSALSNVQVAVSGGASLSMITGADGKYSLPVPTGGTYTVTPSKANHVFTPINKVFTNISGNQVQDFTAVDSTYTLSGRVSTSLGKGLDGVVVSYTGSSIGAITTDTSGTYWFPVAFGSNYTVTPYKAGFTFTPTAQTFTGIDTSIVQNFTASIQIPDAPNLFSPSTNSSSSITGINLVWLSAPRAETYNLQVATNALFVSPFIDRSGMTVQNFSITNLVPGTTYYWRVSASNGTGVSSWSSTWNFTILQSISSAPTPLTPANNSVNVSLTPSLTWSPVSGASYYELNVSTLSDFSTFIFRQSGIVDPNQALAGLLNNTKYYWRVRAENASTKSDWSTTANFTTIPSIPGIVTLSSPTNNVQNLPISTTLKWNGLSSASSYNLQVSINADLSNPVINQTGITTTSYNVDLTNGTKYYWRVSAVNISGAGSWSEVWKFTTISQAATAPTLVNPAYNSVNVSYNPTLNWSAPSGTTKYDLQVSKKSDFQYCPVNESDLTLNYYYLTNLEPYTTYYWRVRSGNSSGYSGWSTSMFRTKQAITGPNLVSPANGVKLNVLEALFVWSRVEDVTNFEFILSKYADFRDYIANPKKLAITSLVITGLEYNTTYFWKVRGVKDNENGSWSEVSSFSTLSDIQGPVLTFPPKDDYGVGLTPTLRWQSLTNILGYDLQVSADKNFTTLLANYSSIENTYQRINSGLVANTTLYWRVRGWKHTNIGEWSEVWSFKTASSSMIIPSVIYPPNQRTNVSIDPVLKWAAGVTGSTYEIKVSDKADMSNIVSLYVDLAATSVSLSGLNFNTTYYWQILSKKDNESSEWSQIYSFTTHGPGVGVENPAIAPKEYKLAQNYPNPFNPSTNISYTIKEMGLVKITIFDIYGREIETLVNKTQNAGSYTITWEPNNVTSGVYYYQLKSGKYSEVRKMMYVR